MDKDFKSQLKAILNETESWGQTTPIDELAMTNLDGVSDITDDIADSDPNGDNSDETMNHEEPADHNDDSPISWEQAIQMVRDPSFLQANPEVKEPLKNSLVDFIRHAKAVLSKQFNEDIDLN